MKKILLMLLTFILVFTTLLPSYTAFSEELEDYCESMSFSIQTVKINDEVIEGKAESGSEIKLEIDGFEEVASVDDNGKFQFDTEEELRAGIKISLKNNQHKIETEVEEIDAKIEMIVSELDGECEIPVDVLAEVEEDQNEEVNESESTSEEPVEETIEIDEEAVNEEVEEIDELSEETETVEEDVISSDESLEETKVEKSTEEIDEETPEQTADEISEESVEDEKIEETTEEIDEETIEQKDDETSKELIEEQKIEERAISKNENNSELKHSSNNISKINQYSINETNESSLRKIQQTKNSSVKVENYEEFKEALNNVHVTLIELTSNIVSNENGSVNLEVKSNSNEKSINGNGFNIHLKNSLIIHNNLRSMTVKNANLQTSDIDHGFFSKENQVVDLYIENVTFDTLKTGKFGTVKEGTVYFSGENIINTNSGNGYNSHALTSKNIIVNKNASLKINHIGSAAALNFKQEKNYSDYGLKIENGANLIIHSSSEVVSTDTSFTIDINKPNNIDFINKSNGRLFNSGSNIEFNIDQVSVHGWNEQNWNDNPPNSITPIVNGQFTFKNGNTTVSESIQEAVQDFTSLFPSDIPRIMFSHSETHTLDLIVNDIYGDSRIISGTTAGNHQVIIDMYDEKDNIIASTESEDGIFEFEVDELSDQGIYFTSGLTLKFQATLVSNKSHKSDIIEKTVIGKLKFLSKPENIIFESTKISSGKKIINRKDENWGLSIKDTRGNKGWKLEAQATGPLKNDNEHTLEDALVFKKDRDDASKSLQERVRISSSPKDETSGTKEISWDDDEGILIEIDPLLAQPDTEYSTTIEWTLTDGP